VNPFGLDIGGSGIKGAPVDLVRGELAADRVRLATPAGAKIAEVAATAAAVVAAFGPAATAAGAHPAAGATALGLGVAFPAPITRGRARAAANVDHAWIDTDVAEVLGKAIGVGVSVINDADAAGLAEMRYGIGKNVDGTVVLLTLGTGIGSALFVDGRLVPNTEFGHLEIDGHDAESKAAESARDRDGLNWEQWAKRLSRYLQHVEALVWPDLFILGGGVSRKADKFLPHLAGVRTKVVPAQLQNEAGIIGAALWAAETRAQLTAAP
jgi:polyphosphate glucokinase